MENWNNLSHFITEQRNDQERMQERVQIMVEAALKGDKITITNLLKQGVPPNCYENTDNLTPLIACIKSEQLELARYLLKVGATVSYRPQGTDALWEALRSNAHNFLELFVSVRCKLTLENDVLKEQPIIMGEDGTTIEIEPKTNNTALIFATKASDEKAVEILLRHPYIKVNERDGLGNTALHYNVSKESMSQEDINIGKMLLAAGADSNATNLEDQTPEDMALDFAARSMLLAGKLENTLPVKEEQPEPELDFDNPSVTQTPSKRMKI